MVAVSNGMRDDGLMTEGVVFAASQEAALCCL